VEFRLDPLAVYAIRQLERALEGSEATLREVVVFALLRGIKHLINDRGRDAGYPAPPAQIRTGPIKASGSYLGCLAANRTFGHG
jgi:hypothetical protein